MHISLLPLLPSLSSLSLLPIPPSLSEVIHPAQVPVVREAFSPSEERVQWASRLISAFNHHQHSGHVSLLHYMQVSWVWLICCFSLVFAFHTSLMRFIYTSTFVTLLYQALILDHFPLFPSLVRTHAHLSRQTGGMRKLNFPQVTELYYH